MVINAGIATSARVHSISRTLTIIKKPTNTRAVEAASAGTSSTSGAINIDTPNSRPVTTDAKPVRAPSPTPEVDSTNEVLEETPPRPPAMAESESISRISRVLGGLPSLSNKFAPAPTATIVPIVSKKSASISEKIKRTTPTAVVWGLVKGPKKSIAPIVDRSGRETGDPCSCGTLDAQAETASSSAAREPKWVKACTINAKTVALTIPIKIAPWTLRT